MTCPKCKKIQTQVIDTRQLCDSVRRRRECDACKYRFSTFERIEHPKLYVIKRDGRREPFNREKLLAGIVKATQKLPISQDSIESEVAKIEYDLYENFKNEISYKVIGEKVMNTLKKLDKVAYIRFASIYRNFNNLKEYQKEIRKIN